MQRQRWITRRRLLVALGVWGAVARYDRTLGQVVQRLRPRHQHAAMAPAYQTELRSPRDADTTGRAATWITPTHHSAYRDVVERQFGGFETPVQDGFFARAWAKPGFVIVICDDHEAGFARFERTSEVLVVHHLVLLPAYQGVGLGTELLRAAQKWAERRGLPVTLQVLRENRAARLYRRLGFEPVGESGPHIQIRWQPS